MALGGQLIAGPAVAMTNGALTYFAEGTDHFIYSTTGGGVFTQVPAQCIGHPAVATEGVITYLACQGLDGKLYYLTNSGPGWSAAQGGVGQFIDGPGISATSAGLTIFGEGTDRAVYHITIPPGGGAPSAFTSDGGSVNHGAAAAGYESAGYAYDGNGMRQTKVAPGLTTSYTWDVSQGAPQLLSETTPQGTTRYLYGVHGLPIERIAPDNSILYFHQDQLGSTRALTDSSGTVQATYAYDSYGNLTAKTGSADTPLRFAGQYTDTETGFQYLRARYYDPGTGQFISRDPAVAKTRSAYGYGDGNPLNATDPNGLCIWDACVGETFGLIDILFGAAIFGTAAGATEYALHSGHGFDASSCPLNPPIPPSAMSAPLPANVLLAKGDIEQVNETASSRGWSKEKRQAFGRYLEESKRHGDRGTQNDRGDYTWPEMQGQADDFEQGYHGN